MALPTFDTHYSYQTLIDDGVPEKQASAIVKIVNCKMDNFVTEQHFDLKLDRLRSELKQDIKYIHTEFDLKLAQLKSDVLLTLAGAESRLFLRLSGVMSLLVAVAVGLIRIM